MGARLALLIGAFGIAYAVLLSHLYDLQINNGAPYLARAESQYLAALGLSGRRGVIVATDREGNHTPLVANKDFPLVYAVPKEIEDSLEAANRLALLFNVPPADLVEALSNKKSQYYLLAKKASTAAIEDLRENPMKGVYIGSAAERFYPFGDLAAHLLGYVGPRADGAGKKGHYGIEEQYESTLSGGAGGRVPGSFARPEQGADVTLTIDPNIQLEAERILDALVKKFRAKGGSVMVQDPRTGKIVTMASVPAFDPNDYAREKISSFMNPVIQQIYEPGSVFKVITMAAGIDAGKITPETTFYDSGVLQVSGRKIQNWDLKAHGQVTMTNVIELSLNTGAAFAERQTGHDIFTDYVRKFGFGEKTGIVLPGEVKGDLRRLDPKSPAVAFATASFGQGLATTPLQMMNAFAAIANGGVLMAPYVDASVKPREVRRVISENAAREVTDMMVSAVDKAEVAQIAGYALAGKTGTAQVPDFNKGGYTDKVINTYIGFGPATDPRFVILFKLNEPEGAPLAGQTVVPAFRDLAQFIINYYRIPPDRLSDSPHP